MELGVHAEWRLRQVTADRLPGTVPSQGTESGQRGRGTIMHASEREGACGQEGTLIFRAFVDTAGVCGLTTKNEWKGGREGKGREGGRTEGKGEREEGKKERKGGREGRDKRKREGRGMQAECHPAEVIDQSGHSQVGIN